MNVSLGGTPIHILRELGIDFPLFGSLQAVKNDAKYEYLCKMTSLIINEILIFHKCIHKIKQN